MRTHGSRTETRDVCMVDRLVDADYSDVDVLAVDELHFYPDVAAVVTEWLR